MSNEAQRLALRSLLNLLDIEPLEYQHPPLMTCEDADALALVREGTRLKNLFLRDNYGRRHILLITTPERRVDLKRLSQQQAMSRLGFASNERLARYLGIEPGCVSALSLVNAQEGAVELWLDDTLRDAALWQCHPLDNRFTWVLSLPDLMRFWQHLGYQPKWITLCD
ncbi:prolyl-tRNA synthetase associated domain-containing protein [Pseudoalteromonas fenneropenaei]|uniref:Prolyl-tRNA synthetase associated domain-containing protein n=1 Tax=Pseudoalteromonas fenneropenaei TaxID=1737459 RepID=A0ABV7CKU1_9GAMM